MRAILLAVVLASVLPGAAAAQSLERQWELCRSDDSERLIRACTAVIVAGHQAPGLLARAFVHRGRAFTGRGEFDRAIRDFGQAIRLDPNYPDVFNDRGVAQMSKGAFDSAVADFDEAIRLDANFAIAIFNRGLALRNMGREAEAQQAFARAREAGPRLVPPDE